MKKEICAGALLALMALCAFWNLRRLEDLADGIDTKIGLAEMAVQEGDFEGALSSIRSGRQSWENSGSVNSVFLSREDMDRVNNAFREEEQALLGGNAGQAIAAGGELRRCLDELIQDQRPSIESIL